MNKLFIILITLVIFGCRQQPSYTISGTVDKPELEGKKAIMYIGEKIPGQHPSQTDSAIIKNGKYIFKGMVPMVNTATIVINREDRENTYWVSFAIENAEINIHTDIQGQTIAYGTELNERYREFQNAKKPYAERYLKAYNAYNSSAKTEEDKQKIIEERAIYSRNVEPLTFTYVKNNINNPAFWKEFQNCAIQDSLQKQKELIAVANDYTKEQPPMKAIIERVATLERIAVGNLFIDLAMKDSAGKETALSNYVGKGKIVLVDFWASWCAPCRAALPDIISTYKKFRPKGFEVVGISLDNNHDHWVKAIREEKLEWPQMSDLKGWRSIAAQTYAISNIPFTLLIDQNGKIIAHNLHGDELYKKLAELLK